MYKFGKKSRERLDTCDPKLQEIMEELIKLMDVTILCGTRSQAEQSKAYLEGRSQLQYPDSKHNKSPSKAVDVAPYPVIWDNVYRFERMCGAIEAIAGMKGIKIRLGRDFSFKDYPHIELLE